VQLVGLRGADAPRGGYGHPALPLHYNQPVPVLHNLRLTLEMIKWEHSIFALPFALCGAMLAAGGFPTAHQLIWIVVAMVAARSAAMAFNRLADASIDAANPRTRTRALPAGQLTPVFVATFVIVLVTPGARICPRHCARRGLDRGARLARWAHPAAHGRGDVLGGGIRCSLRLSGF